MEGIENLCVSCVNGNVPCSKKIIVIKETRYVKTIQCINYKKEKSKIMPYIQPDYISTSICR